VLHVAAKVVPARPDQFTIKTEAEIGAERLPKFSKLGIQDWLLVGNDHRLQRRTARCDCFSSTCASLNSALEVKSTVCKSLQASSTASSPAVLCAAALL
jgi:hypothetical protein